MMSGIRVVYVGPLVLELVVVFLGRFGLKMSVAPSYYVFEPILGKRVCVASPFLCAFFPLVLKIGCRSSLFFCVLYPFFELKKLSI